MTYLASNDARTAPHDAITKDKSGVRGFNRFWTSRAVRLLRVLQTNPFIKQARHNAGRLDENGHGSACVNQVLVELLDNLRAGGANESSDFRTIDRILPLSSQTLIRLNDDECLSFAQIADRIEKAAGGPEALADA